MPGVADRRRPRQQLLRGPSLIPINGHANDVPAPFLAHFNLPDEMGKVELEWHDGRVELDRDHELATEVMCGHIAHALRRVAPEIMLPLRESRPIWAPIDPFGGGRIEACVLLPGAGSADVAQIAEADLATLNGVIGALRKSRDDPKAWRALFDDGVLQAVLTRRLVLGGKEHA